MITASRLKSQQKVLSAYGFDTIPTVPLNKIIPETPSLDLNLSLHLKLIDSKVFSLITPSYPGSNIAEYEKLLNDIKDAVLRITPQEIDELTINRSLVEQLTASRELAAIPGFKVDYQGGQIDAWLRVTSVSTRPDIVLFKRIDPSEKVLAAAVAKVCIPHSESDEDEEDDYNSLYGGVGELKKNTRLWDKFQLLADMVKVCRDLAVLSVRDYGKYLIV